HFDKLDAKATNAYAAISAARPFNVAIRPVPAEFTGSGKTVAFFAGERIDYEITFGKPIVADVGCGQMRAAHVNLGPFAYAREVACGVEQNKLHVFNALANCNCLFRAGSTRQGCFCYREIADRALGFGGAVKTHERGFGRA